MFWTLIVTASMLPLFGQTGAAGFGYSVHGFATKQDCINAGNNVPSPASNNRIAGSAKFVCVPMGVKRE